MDIPKYKKTELKNKENNYCLCIPIYNEGNRILAELSRAKKAKIYEYVDIILLDGGSTDGTIEIETLKQYNVNTLIEMQEQGVYKQSEALKAGFFNAIEKNYTGVITIDGNNKDSIESVPNFVAKLEQGYDFVQGSRFLEGGKHANTPKDRYFAIKYIHAPIISFTAKKKYTDTTTLFRGYSTEYLKHPKVQPFRNVFRAYELSTYLSTKADQLGLKTCEIPIQRLYPSKKYSTKVSRIKGNWKVFKPLISNLFGKYDVKKV